MRSGLARLTKELILSTLRPATIDYPARKPSPREQALVEEGRGKHKFDDEKCVGCGGCVAICSSGAITESVSQSEKVLKVELARCIFCGRCRDICPEKGIELTHEFELSRMGGKAEDAERVEHAVSLGICEGCGRATFPIKQIDAAKKRIGEKIEPSNRETAIKDMEIYMRYCPDCRRARSYLLGTHPRKSY